MLSPRHSSASIGPMVSRARSRPSMLQCRSETIPSFNKGLSVDWRALIFARAEASRPAWWALSLATRSALLFSVRRGFAPEHCPQDGNEEQCCDWPMEPDPVQAGENIDHNQKARNSQGRCNGARQVREPIRDEAHPRGRLVSRREAVERQRSEAATASAWGVGLSSTGAASPDGFAAHGHSIADHGSNVLHLLLAETVEAKG